MSQGGWRSALSSNLPTDDRQAGAMHAPSNDKLPALRSLIARDDGKGKDQSYEHTRWDDGYSRHYNHDMDVRSARRQASQDEFLQPFQQSSGPRGYSSPFESNSLLTSGRHGRPQWEMPSVCSTPGSYSRYPAHEAYSAPPVTEHRRDCSRAFASPARSSPVGSTRPFSGSASDAPHVESPLSFSRVDSYFDPAASAHGQGSHNSYGGPRRYSTPYGGMYGESFYPEQPAHQYNESASPHHHRPYDRMVRPRTAVEHSPYARDSPSLYAAPHRRGPATPDASRSSNSMPLDALMNSAVDTERIPSSPRRPTKTHVQSACLNCKRAHLACDVKRPCQRCVNLGKTETCVDVQHKKRGRPRLQYRDASPQRSNSYMSKDASASRLPSHSSPYVPTGLPVPYDPRNDYTRRNQSDYQQHCESSTSSSSPKGNERDDARHGSILARHLNDDAGPRPSPFAAHLLQQSKLQQQNRMSTSAANEIGQLAATVSQQQNTNRSGASAANEIGQIAATVNQQRRASGGSAKSVNESTATVPAS